jgi:metal-responsive CopG/Arc/MetJ family transcriptional regulator
LLWAHPRRRKKMRVVTFKVEEDLVEQLDRYAIRYGLNRSEAVRKIIENAVKEQLSKETVPLAKVVKISLR